MGRKSGHHPGLSKAALASLKGNSRQNYLPLQREVATIRRKRIAVHLRKRKHMPDRYEREIEDILRRQGDWNRRRSIGPRRSSSIPPFTFSERCLAIAIIAALVGGGWAYALGGGNLITGIIAVIGAVCVALVALSSFIEKRRSSPYNRGR